MKTTMLVIGIGGLLLIAGFGVLGVLDRTLGCVLRDIVAAAACR